MKCTECVLAAVVLSRFRSVVAQATDTDTSASDQNCHMEDIRCKVEMSQAIHQHKTAVGHPHANDQAPCNWMSCSRSYSKVRAHVITILDSS
jgi:hypothetical protein